MRFKKILGVKTIDTFKKESLAMQHDEKSGKLPITLACDLRYGIMEIFKKYEK